MTFKKLLALDMGVSLRSLSLYVLLLMAIFFGSGIVISINLYNGPFTNENVVGVYATLSLLFLIIICVKNILIDFHYKTHYLYLTTKKNRRRYFFTRIIVNGIISIVFAIGGIILLISNYVFNGFSFSVRDVSLLVGEYIIFALFFSCLLFLFTLFYQNVMNLIILFLATYFVFPNILGAVMNIPSIPSWTIKGAELIPLYSLPKDVPMLELSLPQGVVTLLFIVAMVIYVTFKFPKVDY